MTDDAIPFGEDGVTLRALANQLTIGQRKRLEFAVRYIDADAVLLTRYMAAPLLRLGLVERIREREASSKERAVKVTTLGVVLARWLNPRLE